MARISRGMTQQEWKIFNYYKKKDKAFQQHRYYCRCGHSLTIGTSITNKLCSYCGRLVFKDKELQDAYDRELEKREKKNNFIKELNKRL